MAVCLQRVWNFLVELSEHNNKPWFDAHKSMYQDALADAQVFSEALITGISKFDKSVSGLTVKDCTYRIYRDLRFSLDKTPYKTHWGVYVCPQGKKSGNAGYYVHIEPGATSMLVSGLYMPSPESLKSVREEIMCNGSYFDAAVKASQGFSLDWNSALKRIPRGWNAEDEYSEYYKLKDFSLIKPVTRENILNDSFLEYAIAEFEKTYEFNVILNRCVSYARETL